jgi:hypothetical protein
LWDSTQKNLPQCIPQCCRFSFVVSHNGRDFPPLWDTSEEIFSIAGYNGRGFFPLWDTMEKIYTTQNDILNFKCLPLPSNKNLGKISQTIPWKELKMKYYMVDHEKKKFCCGIHRSRDFLNF